MLKFRTAGGKSDERPPKPHPQEPPLDPVRRLVGVLAQLRARGGCPWDRRQTHRSLKPYLLEEAHELLEALDSGDPQALREELGDLLLQVVFHAQIAREKGRFDFDDVAAGAADKLVRRHPHVFGSERDRSLKGLRRRWEALKREEKPHRASVLDGLPRSLPALLRAQRAHDKVASLFPERKGEDPSFRRLARSFGILRRALAGRAARRARERALGDFLLELTRASRRRGVHAEFALKESLRRFEAEVRRKERRKVSPPKGRSPRTQRPQR